MLTSVSLKPQRSTSVGANHAWRKSLAKIAHKVVAPPARSFCPFGAEDGASRRTLRIVRREVSFTAGGLLRLFGRYGASRCTLRIVRREVSCTAGVLLRLFGRVGEGAGGGGGEGLV